MLLDQLFLLRGRDSDQLHDGEQFSQGLRVFGGDRQILHLQQWKIFGEPVQAPHVLGSGCADQRSIRCPVALAADAGAQDVANPVMDGVQVVGERPVTGFWAGRISVRLLAVEHCTALGAQVVNKGLHPRLRVFHKAQANAVEVGLAIGKTRQVLHYLLAIKYALPSLLF